MNSFVVAREAIEARRDHICNSSCARNSAGLCLTRIALWDAQHEAVMAWNAPVNATEPVSPSYNTGTYL